MDQRRRRFLKGIGGTLALPLLNATPADSAPNPTPTRLLIVGNPFGMHPEHFFPGDYGRKFTISPTLESLEWVKDRLTILSHTDHGMQSGHGRELAFLSGVLPETSQAFPEKNMSLDQHIARRTGGRVRFPSVHATMQRTIRMSWDANGVDIRPFTDAQQLFDHLFLNLTDKERRARRQVIESNGSILDAVRGELGTLQRKSGREDRTRLEQFADSVRALETTLTDRAQWIEKDKPKFDISEHFSGGEVTIHNRYDAVFDMIAYAFETDLTRVATIGFSPELKYTDVSGVTRGYHACTHNGKKEDVVDELVSIESFQIAQLSRMMKKLDSIREPGTNGTLLDNTVILFGSGMGYGGTHSNRNLPIFVAGGGFRHKGHVDTRDAAGNNMPLCNLFVTLLQRFGIERDSFNTSTAKFNLPFAGASNV